MVGVYASRCLVKGCRGRVGPEYTDKELYDQLCYYASLVDVESALQKAASAAKAGADAKVEAGVDGKGEHSGEDGNGHAERHHCIPVVNHAANRFDFLRSPCP